MVVRADDRQGLIAERPQVHSDEFDTRRRIVKKEGSSPQVVVRAENKQVPTAERPQVLSANSDARIRIVKEEGSCPQVVVRAEYFSGEEIVGHVGNVYVDASDASSWASENYTGGDCDSSSDSDEDDDGCLDDDFGCGIDHGMRNLSDSDDSDDEQTIPHVSDEQLSRNQTVRRAHSLATERESGNGLNLLTHAALRLPARASRRGLRGLPWLPARASGKQKQTGNRLPGRACVWHGTQGPFVRGCRVLMMGARPQNKIKMHQLARGHTRNPHQQRCTMVALGSAHAQGSGQNEPR